MRFNLKAVFTIAAIASTAFGLPQSSYLAERNGGIAITKAPRAGDLFERYVCCDGHCVYKLVGDGDPHTDYLHKQVSDPLSCGQGGSSSDGCSVSYLKSYTIGWSVNVGGTVSWLSGGFSVQESVTTGNSYTCNAASGETVCVWANIPHIAYTVEKGVDDVDICDNQPDGPLVMESPTGDVGYYCVYGDACQVNGFQYWCYTNDGVSSTTCNTFLKAQN